jgi:hypothetical protein
MTVGVSPKTFLLLLLLHQPQAEVDTAAQLQAVQDKHRADATATQREHEAQLCTSRAQAATIKAAYDKSILDASDAKQAADVALAAAQVRGSHALGNVFAICISTEQDTVVVNIVAIQDSAASRLLPGSSYRTVSHIEIALVA